LKNKNRPTRQEKTIKGYKKLAPTKVCG